MKTISKWNAIFAIALLLAPVPLRAQDTVAGAQKLAKQLSNPVASLISVPYQFNYDEGLGASGSGQRTTMNLQPVVPISISANWNLISRTIIPFVDQRDIVPGTRQSGLGDVVQSFFFSPKEPSKGGLIWGAGPAFLLPTGETGLSADKFAAGITGVVLKQKWTMDIWGFGQPPLGCERIWKCRY